MAIRMKSVNVKIIEVLTIHVKNAVAVPTKPFDIDRNID